MIPFLIILGFCFWYFVSGLDCWCNSGGIGFNQFLMPFQWFWQSLLWTLPGAARRKGEYIKEYIEGDDYGRMYCGDKTWSYSEIREQNAYEIVGCHRLPGWKYFLCTHVLVPATPLLLYFMFRF